MANQYAMQPDRKPESAQELAARGDALYESQIRPQVESGNRGKVVAIDVISGVYALAGNALDAADRLLAQRPDAEIWCVRIGHRGLHHIGARSVAVST